MTLSSTSSAGSSLTFSSTTLVSISVASSWLFCSRPPRLPNASPNIPSTLAISDCSRATSAEVFFLATSLPLCRPTRRGLNSGCAQVDTNTPAWCRGYHAGLSFLRPGFNSRSGRQQRKICYQRCMAATNRLRKEDYSHWLS